MREHPILFSTDMVQANLVGRKTQTRRIFKDHPRLGSDLTNVDLKKWMGDHPEYILSFCPYGNPGDLLWVRESFTIIGNDTVWDESVGVISETPIYVFRGQKRPYIEKLYKWKPSIHMPKAAARIWLQVNDVRVERVQDISEYDAMWEGVESWNEDFASEPGAMYADWKNYTWIDDETDEDYHFPTFSNASDSYRTLWCKIHGPKSWDENPWVWVIEYDILSKKGRQDIPAEILQQLDGKELPA